MVAVALENSILVLFSIMTILRIRKKLIVLIVMMTMIVIFWQNPDK